MPLTLGNSYAPPGVYTKTLFDSPLAGALDTLKIPVLIGEGNEYLIQRDLEVVRGSSKTLDQKIVNEDETGRAVLAVTAAGVVTVGDFDGVTRKFQVRNFPIVSGDGSGTTSNSRSDVSVKVDNLALVVLSVDGAKGIVELAQAPKVGAVVQCTYFFNRTDTRITEDVSDQVTATAATVRATTGLADANSANPTVPAAVLDLHGDIKNAQGVVVVPANNVLLVTVDGVAQTITLPAKVDYTMAQVANAITAALKGTLTASTFINNFGHSTLMLSATNDLVVGEGSANALVGLTAGQASTRAKTFYTFQGPIVDGTDGGVITTDPAHVVVKVDNVQVIPTKVDGKSRAVTLASAPKVGAKVTIQYWFNAWQDTFDYLAHTNVASVTSLGEVPGSSGFVQGSDFVLQSDRILWGTAAAVAAGITTVGKEFFDDSQVVPTLIDNRTYLSVCTAATASVGGLATTSQTEFVLPFQPTLGNGRDTKLGQSLFQTVANGRIDLPVNRPDVVSVYWGFSVQDALNRGKQKVLKVEGSNITLADKVPVGASVYASFYHNLLVDQAYTLTVDSVGQSGVGTYTITNQGGTAVLNPKLDLGSKGAGLAGVTLTFPSGSELAPDTHFESVSGDKFKGPVEEIVTVRFAARQATMATWTVPGSGPYEFVSDQSDQFSITLDAVSVPSNGTVGVDLHSPGPVAGGFFANMVGNEVSYTGGTGATVGQSYSLSAAEDISLTIDGVAITARAHAQNNVVASHFANVINEAASGHSSTTPGGGTNTNLILNATPFGAGTTPSTIDNYYVGWRVVLGTNAAAADRGCFATVTAYNGGTRTCTLSTFSMLAADGSSTVTATWPSTAAQGAGVRYNIYNPATMAVVKGATRFNGSVTLANNLHDKLRIHFNGLTTTASDVVADLGNGPFASANLLADEVETRLNVAVFALGAAVVGMRFDVSADADGRLQFSVQLPGDDSSGYFQFRLPVGGAATDFAVLAGLDTAGVDGTQAAVLQGPVCRVFSLSQSSFRLHDRLIFRNRLVPGKGASLSGHDVLSQCSLKIDSGSGLAKAGLVAGTLAEAGMQGTVMPASLAGRISIGSGLTAGAAEPQVTFFDGTGASGANNVLAFTLDGFPITVTFQSSAAGIATPLGPVDNAWNGTDAGATILTQIARALSLVATSPFGATIAAVTATNRVLLQEGSGFRLSSLRPSTPSGVVIGTGSANTVLGFTSGAVAQRSLVSASRLASALMANRVNNSFAIWMNVFTDLSAGGGAERFAAFGLALPTTDTSGATYLQLQSLTAGATSIVRVNNAIVGGVVTDNALAFDTGLDALANDGAVGEAALDGYFVTSNVANGSGTDNTSILNNGTGQDGVVGQTYRDKVTGLTFTILPRGWHDNEVGPWSAYPTGSTATFRINVSKTVTCDANLPHNAVNGLDLKVSNTLNLGVGDTATVTTYKRGGNEPAIGDVYYVTYTYTKADFTTSFFTKLSALEQAFGAVDPKNPVSLAAYLALLNGAVLVGVKQVPRATGTNFASLDTYKLAIEELEGVLPGQVKPDVIVPLKGDSLDLYQVLKRSNEIQSSIRYKAERTSILGVGAGYTPADVGAVAEALKSSRMRMVYPDMAVIQITDGLGVTKEHLVDGPMLAAAMTGSVVSPNLDVATPWTGRQLVGFVKLGRILDAVEQNQTAQKGITILEDRGSTIKVRHGLTTDLTSVLTKIPTVTLIADEVQRQSRGVLEQFIGMKFLPAILPQIEGRMAMMFKSLVAQQIVQAYTGVKATVAADDPTACEVSAAYAPIFPLLYIVVTYNVRASV